MKISKDQCPLYLYFESLWYPDLEWLFAHEAFFTYVYIQYIYRLLLWFVFLIHFLVNSQVLKFRWNEKSIEMESLSSYLYKWCRFSKYQDSNMKSCTSLKNNLQLSVWLTNDSKMYFAFWKNKKWWMTLIALIPFSFFIHTSIFCFCLPSFRCCWLKAKKGYLIFMWWLLFEIQAKIHSLLQLHAGSNQIWK